MVLFGSIRLLWEILVKQLELKWQKNPRSRVSIAKQFGISDRASFMNANASEASVGNCAMPGARMSGITERTLGSPAARDRQTYDRNLFQYTIPG